VPTFLCLAWTGHQKKGASHQEAAIQSFFNQSFHRHGIHNRGRPSEQRFSGVNRVTSVLEIKKTNLARQRVPFQIEASSRLDSEN
jgi:hypothetical protein